MLVKCDNIIFFFILIICVMVSVIDIFIYCYKVFIREMVISESELVIGRFKMFWIVSVVVIICFFILIM